MELYLKLQSPSICRQIHLCRYVMSPQPNSPLSFLSFVVCFLLLILSANSVGAQEEQSQAIKTGTISGRVINEKGQPIYEAGVTIRAFGAIRPSGSTITDRDGNFQFSGLSPVVYFLNALFPAYASAPR